MKLSSLLLGVKTQDVYEERDIERVTQRDTDNLKNSLFICVDGNRVDGHSLAKNVLEKGALAVVTDRDLGLSQQIIVEDTRKAFSQIAANFYGNAHKELKIIGITGTNGKTSTCFYIKQILEHLGISCGIIGTVKNSIGERDFDSVLTTPEPMELHKLFREMADMNCEYCVMEVSSQALSQQRVFGVKFAGSAITNITPEHLDYHMNMENYIDAKMELFKSADFAVVNLDDENIKNNLHKIDCKTLSYSAVSNNADYTAKNVVVNENGIKYELVSLDSISRISSRLCGKFTVYNTLCAVSVLINLGFDIYEISDAVAYLTSVKGRAEEVEIPKNFKVLIDYAHTPDGLLNILSATREITKGKVILVFGCGGDRDKHKRAEMGKIAGDMANLVVVTSDNPRTENPLLIINDILCGMERAKSRIAVIENRREAIHFALSKARTGDTVLLCGKGHEMYQIIGHDKIPFDERAVIKEYFK